MKRTPVRVDKDTLFDLIQEGDKLETDTWRWGVDVTYHVVHEGKDYLLTARFHTEDGLQDEEGLLYPAKLVEKVVREWVDADAPGDA